MKEFDDLKLEIFKVSKMPEIVEWLSIILEQFYNWIIKQIFYLRYLVLKQDKSPRLNDIIFSPGNCHVWNSFDKWSAYLPWFAKTKPRQDWNTFGIFNQLYGKFYFKARLDGLPVVNDLVGHYVPAIWLLDIADNHYYEIDIELFRDHFGYTIHVNHTGGKDEPGYEVRRSMFANRKLRRNLQKDFHLFLIDWNKDWIRFYINGILTAKFRNEIHTPLQIVMSKCSMTKTIVK